MLNSLAGDVAVNGTVTSAVLRIEFQAKTPQGELPIVMTGDFTGTGAAGKAGIAGMGEVDWTATRVP
ncbi:MAG: hypothetical protein GEU82_17775 [Luteitalea sp.]|nr:hypothetical protein [Luteitalea sp.]